MEQKPSNPINFHSTGRSPSGYNSVQSSFSSSTGSYTSVEAGTATPGSSSQSSSASLKPEDAYLSTSFFNPDGFGTATGYCAMSALTQDMMNDFEATHIGPNYSGNTKVLQDESMMDYNNFPAYTSPLVDTFGTCNGYQSRMPSLEHGLSSPTSGDGSSPMSSNFVVPSQTFIEGYELQSPMRPGALHFDLHYDNAEADFAEKFSLENSPPGKMSYLMLPGQELKPSSTSPTRPATSRQPKPEPIMSPVLLRGVESAVESRADTDKRVKSQAARLQKRRQKREERDVKDSILYNTSCRVESKPQRLCQWPKCSAKFKRQEHLKRHEKTHAGNEWFPCPFCPIEKHKIFNRTDNLKAHVLRHTEEGKKSSRTQFVAEAIPLYAELCLMKGKPRKQQEPNAVKQERLRHPQRVPLDLETYVPRSSRHHRSSTSSMAVSLSGSMSGST